MTDLPVRPDVTDDDLVLTRDQMAEQLARIRQALTADGLRGYVALTPSNVHYLTGYESYFLSTWWRMHGKIFAALSTDRSHAPAIVMGDAEDQAGPRQSGVEVFTYRMWVEPSTLEGIKAPARQVSERPAQWSEEELDGQTLSMLRELDLTEGPIGCDLRYITYDAFSRLQRLAPDVQWVDFSDAMYRVRSIKANYEIARLQAATQLADAGMQHSVSIAGSGTRLHEIRAGFAEGVALKARSTSKYRDFASYWVLPAFGRASNIGASQEAVLRDGDLIKFDCGTTVAGYRSDHGRTFAFGEPSKPARELFTTLKHAHDVALTTVQPGALARDVFEAAETVVRSNGYPNYNRGHFGHSVGMDTFHEEPPFLSRHDETPLEVGMVLAVETPFYGHDVGAIMIEDLVHVVDGGGEVLSNLSRDLVTFT